MNVLARVAISLLRDLLIPWIISATCIVVFFLVVAAFGLIAWPICFGIFLFVCIVRHPHRAKPDDGPDQVEPNAGNDPTQAAGR